MKVLVTGSTGKVGSVVVETLAKAGLQVRAASRTPQNSKPMENVETVRFDYADSQTFTAALNGVDSVFLMEPQPATGPADQVMLPMVHAAIEDGCKIVLLSSASVGFQQEPLSNVEAAVKAKPRHVILRANWFMDNFHTWWAEPIRYNNVLPLPAGTARSPFIDARDVGAAAAAALTRDDVDGTTFVLTGSESLSYSTAASLLSRATQNEVRYVPMEDAVFAATLSQAGLPSDYIEYILSLFRLTRSGVFESPTADFEHLTRQKPRTLEQYISDYREAWQ